MRSAGVEKWNNQSVMQYQDQRQPVRNADTYRSAQLKRSYGMVFRADTIVCCKIMQALSYTDICPHLIRRCGMCLYMATYFLKVGRRYRAEQIGLGVENVGRGLSHETIGEPGTSGLKGAERG